MFTNFEKMNKLSLETVRLLTSSQVITSVSSAVKELVENALDAEATSIEVKLEKLGFNKIEVRDNGCGIKERDTSVMAQRFYTSKISKHEDLYNLSTYGFRGEALGSLCQISDVSITTKTAEDNVAVCYVLDSSGKISSKRPTHDGNGTTVSASNLFKNLPVRKQFYNNTKKCKEELKKIEDILMAYGLMKPEVRLSLKNNKASVWQKSKSCDLKTAMMDVFGVHVCHQLDYFEYINDEKQLSLKCYLPKNDSDYQLTSRSTEDRCFIFINKRYVVWKELIQVLKKTCTWKINCGRFPLCFLSLELPAEDVDANIEPNKTRVLIKQKEHVLAIISQELNKLYKTDSQNGDPSFDCSEETPGTNFDKQFPDVHQNRECINLRETDRVPKKNDVNKATCQSQRNKSVDPELNHIGMVEDIELEDRNSDEILPKTVHDIVNSDNSRLDNNTLNKSNIDRENFLENSALGNDVAGNNTFSEHVPDDSLKQNNVKNIFNKNKNSTPLVPSSEEIQREFDDVVNDLVDDLSVLDDSAFTIDPLLPNQEKWSKGFGLSDENGKSIEPVNLLVPSIQSTLSSKGKRKHSSLSHKDSLSKCPTNSKRVKKISKISGQPLLTSVLHSPKTSKLVNMGKKLMRKQVSFSLSSLKLACDNRQEAPTTDEIKLIKRLDPWGVWLISRKRELSILNPYRVQEILLYKRLLATHVIPREQLGSPIIVNERILGSVSRYCFLENLIVGDKSPESNVIYCSDERLVANGFEIRKRSDHENGKTTLEIVKMNTTIPYFGIQDLIEVLDSIKEEQDSHLSNGRNLLACCRPRKVCDFLKDEVVRVARGLASRLSETDIVLMLTKMKKELKDEENTCIHNLPFLYPLTSY